MADRGIGQQAFDIGLADGRKGPEAHRAQSDEDDNLLPLCGNIGKSRHDHTHGHRHGSQFGSRGKEGGHRCWRPFIDIRRPHVERHSRHLECQTGHQEGQTEDHAAGGMAVQSLGNGGKFDRTGKTIDQRSAIEQHAGRQRAEHKIFQARFGRLQIIAAESGNDIKSQTGQFEAEIERNQIMRRNHHHHAEGGQQHQHRKFKGIGLVAVQKALRHHKRQGRCQQHDHLHEAGKAVNNESAVKRDLASFGLAEHEGASHQQHHNGHGLHKTRAA